MKCGTCDKPIPSRIDKDHDRERCETCFNIFQEDFIEPTLDNDGEFNLYDTLKETEGE